MAADDIAIVSWNANTDDTVLYKVYYGDVQGTYLGSKSTNTNAATLIPFLNINVGQFTHDGRWYMAVTALDAAVNESNKSSVVSKRIIRTRSFIRVVK